MKQSEAVIQATFNTLRTYGVAFTPGQTDVRTVVTQQIRREIIDQLIGMFETSQVELKDTDANKSKLTDPKLLRNYVNGLVTNWFNKSKELNGNTSKPSKKKIDAQLKELHVLKSELETHNKDQESIDMVVQAIMDRESELAM